MLDLALIMTLLKLAAKDRAQGGGEGGAAAARKLSFRDIFTARLVGFLFAPAGIRSKNQYTIARCLPVWYDA